MQSHIQERIDAIRRGEVPQGYKKDKRGLYPKDWPIKKMKEWLHYCERPVTLEDEQEYTLLTVRRGFGGVDNRGVFLGKSILVKTYFQVKAGDFVISKRQISHGACGVVGRSLDNAVVSNEYNIFLPQKQTDMHFFLLMMQLPYYHRLFYLMSDGVHIEKLLFKTKDWLKQTIALPPLAEQQKIVAILNTCDTLIALQEKLIAAKKRQKKYLMQQLLTGKKRLSGFSGKWKKVKLGEICTMFSGGTPLTTKSSYYNGGIPFIRSAEIGSEVTELCISSDGLQKSSARMINKGDLLYALYGANSGECALSKIHGAINQAVLCIRSESSNIEYLYFVLFNAKLSIVSSYLQGGQGNLSASIIKELKFSFPPLPEQTAIAAILSTANKEIDLLKQNLEQEKRKKKALMQLLLTGVVRVQSFRYRKVNIQMKKKEVVHMAVK